MANAVTISGEATNACVVAKSIITLCKVPVEGSNDRVLAVGIVDMPCPLADTGTAGIGQHHAAHLVESIQQAISLNGIAHQFRARGDGKFALGFQAFSQWPAWRWRPSGKYLRKKSWCRSRSGPLPASSGQPFAFTASAILEIGVARSGVKGPFTCGSSSSRFISITWS